MCKLGDIIVVNAFKNEFGEIVKKHSFVVINDEENSIEGLNYDFIANMLCSFHDDKHKSKKLRFKENLEITENNISSEKANDKTGYIKSDQLYYFNKEKIKYYVLGQLNPDLLDELLQLILVLNNEGKLKLVTTNLAEPVLE